VPEVEPATIFLLKSYPQAYPQAGQGVGGRADRTTTDTPPLLNCGAVRYILPNKKYLLK